MKQVSLKKKFPKPFFKAAILDKDLSHSTCHKCSPQDSGQTVDVRGISVDNKWIVPYNLYC